jgi:hypothetical protein
LWLLLAVCFLSTCLTDHATAQNVSRHKLLLASDIHLNPMADATLVSELQQAAPENWETILNKTQPRSFSPYGQDTNWWLLQSALEAMRKTMPQPAVFLITGDLLAHNFPKKFSDATHDDDPQHYRAFVLKTVQFIALQLRRRWPQTQILLTPGNNDDDCGDYAIEAAGTFLSDTAPTVRELAHADDQAVADWKAIGSYVVQPAAISGVRIASLNTVFFSAKYEAQSFQNKCAEVESTAASKEFDWLERSVADAKQAGQKMWLMFHIPPGIDGYASVHGHSGSCEANIIPMWAPEWTVKFDSFLVSQRGTVLASFAGHTHTDDFRVVTDGDAPVQFVLIDPPISPVYAQNPAFRVFEFKDGDELANQTTYYLTNLTTADAKQRAEWKSEYVFKKEWKAKRLDSASLGKIYTGITNDDAARLHWLKLYNVSSSAAKVAPNDVRGLYCAIEGLGVGAYRNCACVSGP